jgi:predicted DNA-binding WGR domain protein
MKRIKESNLFFKEGNSDKVYEIDISEVGPNQYTVNFRYGRRGSPLKEGSKTTTPVGLAAAQTVFDGLELEKRKKGYQSESEMFQPLPTVATAIDTPPATREEAILRRLAALASGQTEFKTAWKPSRVIWRAGVLRIREGVPFLIRLVDRGDDMQRRVVGLSPNR